METGVLAATTSHPGSHGRGSVIARRFLRHAYEQGVRIGAVVAGGEGVGVADLEHRVPIVEQNERVGLAEGHVDQLRAVVAFRPAAVDDVPVGGQLVVERLTRQREDQRLPLVRRQLAARQRVAVRVAVRPAQFLAVSAALENRQLRLRQIRDVRLRDDGRRDCRDERENAARGRPHDSGRSATTFTLVAFEKWLPRCRLSPTSREFFERAFSSRTIAHSDRSDRRHLATETD